MTAMPKGKSATGSFAGALRRDRRSTVAVMFAAMAIPVTALAGLAMDYGLWSEAYGTLNLAVNEAALNAVKTAGAADLQKDNNFLAEGKTAGQQWFAVELGQGANTRQLSTLAPNVTVSISGTIITATVAYSGTMPSLFGHIFSIAQYPMKLSASAEINTAPFLNVTILLDNSSSMQIGATPGDVAAIMEISPCDPSSYDKDPGNTPYAVNYYSYYECKNTSYNWTFPTSVSACPVVVNDPPWQVTKLTPNSTPGSGNNYGPTCKGFSGSAYAKNADGSYPAAGPPCAFACHSDNTKPAGSGPDAYGMVRGTLGKGYPLCSSYTPPNVTATQLSACAITLRFDSVKAAVNTVINTMASDNTANNNLAVGIWDFNSTLNRDYPPSGEAGDDFNAALAAVGAPPTTTHGADTGIQPDAFVVQGAHDDTYFTADATQLTQTLTAAGNGNTAATPRKVLFLVTDGISDVSNGSGGQVSSLFSTAPCTTFKNMGYTVYVVYTPYYPLAWDGYVTGGLPSLVEPTATSADVTNLTSCASASADFLIATDTAGLTSALTTFLKAALNSPVIFTN